MAHIDSIIQKYLKGTTSDAEIQQLYEWVQMSEENRKHLFSEKDIWDTFGYHSNKKGFDTDAELDILKAQMTSHKRNFFFTLNTVLKIAAVIVIAFGLGWATRFFPSGKEELKVVSTMQKITVPKGQVNQVFLADGTRVWINSDSKMDIPSIFASDERSVRLSGEAFFEVAKDSRRPFRVEVNGQKVEVLGTSFNIRAYSSSNEIETTLATGQIKLFAGNQEVVLEPGEQSLFNLETGQLTFQRVDPLNYSSWKDGRFEFQNEDLVEVFNVVERWYDVEIKYDASQFEGMRFSGVIKRNKDVKHFLNLLDHSIPINYKIDLDKIVISLKIR